MEKLKIVINSRLVGTLKFNNNQSYYDDYRLNDYNIDLDCANQLQAQGIIVDYLTKDVPCMTEQVKFIQNDKIIYDGWDIIDRIYNSEN